MEALEQISLFRDFFEQNCMDKILKASRIGKPFEIIFSNLSEFSLDLANELLDSPEETIKAAELALKELDINNPRARIIHLPATQRRDIWEIRKDDIGKLIAIKGVINKSSSIIHVCTSAKFECPNCGSIINILQPESDFKEPSKCTCGRKGKFNLLSKELSDTIKLGLIDDLMDKDNADRSIAREKIAILSKGLTSFEIDKEIKPGRKVIVNGWLQYIQKGKSTEFDSIFIVNSIEFVEVGWDTIKVNAKEEKEIKGLAKEKDIIYRLSDSIADVYGFQEVKIASLLLLAGAPHMYDKNGHLTSRGTIHMLLIGNPGEAKTYLAKRAGAISPIFSFQSAATASGKGLVAAVVQDKDIGAWTIYPGVVAMANKGVVTIDEIDKTHKEDYGDHNNAMNDMMVIIAKSNVKGKLQTETSYLATANPENRVFTQYEDLINQIDMPKDFLDRFDIILPMISPLDKEEKEKIMDTMLDRHFEEKEVWQPEFSHEFITKYIAYCRMNNPKPKLPKELASLIKKKLHELMKPKDEGQIKVSFRQIESIMRFAYASARLKLRDITEEDINLAFDLKKKSFLELGIIDRTGSFSWAKLENVDEGKLSNKEVIHSVMKELFAEKEMVEWQEIINRCRNKGVDEDVVDEHIENVKRKGDYFEPRKGFVSRI